MTRIFISHSHSDKDIVEKLVDFLLASLQINDDEIRCTSVPGYQLPFGTSIGEQLKKNLNNTTGLIALITKDSLLSTWVLFELGSSWAMNKLVVPIIGSGVTYDNLPGPLKDYPGVLIFNYRQIKLGFTSFNPTYKEIFLVGWALPTTTLYIKDKTSK